MPEYSPDDFDVRDAGEGPPPDASPETKAATHNPWPSKYRMTKSGLIFESGDDGAKWLSGPFAIEGATRNADGSGWGLFLSWQDEDGAAHTWNLPKRLLIGETGEVEGRLLDQGLTVAASAPLRQKFREALLRAKPMERIRTVMRTGWCADGARVPVYVGADGTVFGRADERIMLTAASSEAAGAVAASGTLGEWQSGVAALATGNHLAATFLAAAFAGPVLDVLGEPGGGLHAFGKSQKGKTTILRMAASAWGPPVAGKALRSWRGTSNGMEGVAAAANDGLLALDELGQCDGREAAEIAYMLSNGQGKTRATRDGSARQAKAWRLFALSTGEIDLPTKIAEGGKKVMAGQLVRMVSVPLPDGGPLADDLHGRGTAHSLLVEINDSVGKYHGTAAPAFLTRLAADRAAASGGLASRLGTLRDAWLRQYTPPAADGQVQAVARRLAAVSAAGELAAAYGVLPWRQGEASLSVSRVFAHWLLHRGGAGAYEDAEAVEAVRIFVAQHGASRYAVLGEDAIGGTDTPAEKNDDRVVVNRAGWRSKTRTGAWEYWTLPAIFNAEVCKGRDPAVVVNALREAKLLRCESDRQATVKVAIKGYNRLRVYAIKAEILGEGAAA